MKHSILSFLISSGGVFRQFFLYQLVFLCFSSYLLSQESLYVSTDSHEKQSTHVLDSEEIDVIYEKQNSKGEFLFKKEIQYDPQTRKMQVGETKIPSNEQFITTYEYDQKDHLIALTQYVGTELEKKTTFVYDECGRKIETVKPDGAIIHYSYDSLGRLKEKFAPTSFHYVFEYDLKDNIVQVGDLIRQESTYRTFDDKNRLIQETLGNGLTLSYVYDTEDRLTYLSIPDGSSVEYIYEGEHLREIYRNGLSHRYLSDHVEAEFSSMQLMGQTGEVTVRRDDLGRIVTISTPYWSETDIQYDEEENIISSTLQDQFGEERCSFLYDDLHQLKEEKGVLSKQYTPYLFHSRTQVEDGVRVLFDQNGNVILRGIGEEVLEFFYDPLDRLAAVVNGETKIEYAYDAFNRRLSRIFLKKCASPALEEDWTFLRQESFLYQYNNEIGSFEKGIATSFRVLGKGLGAEIGAAVLIELHGRSFVPIHDHIGNVRCLVDMEEKRIAETYRYSAFGQKLTANSVQNPWGFSSKRFDLESGLLFFGRRYYDPSLCKWTTEDPSGPIYDFDLYAYVENNPLIHIDLYGYSQTDAHSVRNASHCPSISTQEKAGAIQTIYSEEMKGSNRFYLHPSQNRLIKGHSFHPGVSVGYNNGINTHLIDAVKTTHFISHSHGDIDVVLSYGNTSGVLADLYKCGLHKIGVGSEETKLTYKSLQEQFRQVGENGRVIRYAHSAGVATLCQAAKRLDPNQKYRLEIHALGGAVIVPKSGYGKVVNYISKQDSIARFAIGKPGLEKAKREGSLVEIESVNQNQIDHGILDETYRGVIRIRGDEYKNLFNNL